MTTPGRPGEGASLADAIRSLKERMTELERDRDRLLALAALAEDLQRSLHFVDILQAVASRVGSAYALDRCSVFLTGDDDNALRLVASFEDPALRNLTVDPRRYPELQRAIESGETVFIPDATAEPLLRPVWNTLAQRNVQSILVVPMKWEGRVIGALFLRTARAKPPLDDGDVAFCQRVTSMTAQALHQAHEVEALRAATAPVAAREQELRRVALLRYVQQLLDQASSDGDFGGGSLTLTAADEVERLVDVTLRALKDSARD